MKTILTKFLALSSIMLLMLPACKKDEVKVVATNGTASTLTANSTTLVLDKSKLYDTSKVVTFSLTKPNFGYSAAITNTLQIDVPGDNWANPSTAVLGAQALSQAYNTGDFNALLLKLNLPAGVASAVQVRVKSSIGASVAPVYSNVLSLTATPFNLASYMYVPGAYEGWNPAASATLVSPTSNGVFTGIINFTGTDLSFKVTSAADWNHTNYGAGSTAGTISSTGGNLTAPATGGLLLTVDLNKSTIMYTPQWSIIGDATSGGWGTDTNMLYDSVHDTWYITATLGVGGMKFRYKNDWTVNLGGSGGTLTANGPNIAIATAGTYTIKLNANTNTYTIQ